jgi:UDP-N-acetylmuramoyl-L-alanyl-D-glutamate--2,6-diaminopimelate ligase
VVAALGVDPATGLRPGRASDPGSGLDAALDVVITGVCLDSRAVRPGDLYAALPGQRTHGARFASAAAELGAAAVLTDPAGVELAEAAGLPVLAVDDPRAVLGGLAAWLFGEPAQQMLMLAVTGTNGKTTTTFLMDAALRRGGRRCGLVGTVETRILDRRLPSVRTTPEAPDLQALLALMVAEGADTCSMEVSSHALALGRVDGIRFDVAGFTNLSQDHLDFHATMAEYFAAKAALFTPGRARSGVICVDDEWGRRLAETATIPIVTIGTRPAEPDTSPVAEPDAGPASESDASSVAGQVDWQVTERRPDGIGTDFTLRGPAGQTVAAHCPLPGDFNVANTALALVMLVTAGIAADDAAGWLALADPVPGRMEQIPGTGAAGEPLAVVDYAHTPDAVAAALRTLRSARSGPLVVVFGAGGDRDRAKRPRMGEAAAREADVVIVTDDNPRSEDAAAIRAAVLAGTGSFGREVVEIADRRAAVLEGVRRAWGGGTLLVAGKGHERGQDVAGTVHPFDDRQVVAEALRSYCSEVRK